MLHSWFETLFLKKEIQFAKTFASTKEQRTISTNKEKKEAHDKNQRRM